MRNSTAIVHRCAHWFGCLADCRNVGAGYPEPFDLRLVKVKSVSTHWENMFTRSIFQTEDMEAQHDLLTRLSEMIDYGQIRTTLAEVLGPINAENLSGAHARIWERRAPGKMVMVGF
jgi:NADPH:quinone reductase-like Zn-dependent oxidoreductase